MNVKKIILVIVIILGLMFALGCSDSGDNSETSVESENIQTGETKAIQEEEPEPAITEETETVTETPVQDDTEESSVISLEEAKGAEEETLEENDKEPEVDMETRMKEIREEEAEEETEREVEESKSTISSDDAIWIDVMLDDLADVRADMDDVSRAASTNDMASLAVYADNMYASTNIAIDHCDRYDVSADLQPVEDEYRLAMVAYNWAAVSCYAGIESFNSGNAAEAEANFNNAGEFINSGTDHTLQVTELMNEYNENHRL